MIGIKKRSLIAGCNYIYWDCILWGTNNVFMNRLFEPNFDSKHLANGGGVTVLALAYIVPGKKKHTFPVAGA